MMAACLMMKQQLGMRRAEICNLRNKDIHFPDQSHAQDSTSYILVDLYRSKTDANAQGVRLCLWKNQSQHPLASRLCAKSWLEFWLSMHPNIRNPEAALFPFFDAKNNVFAREMTLDECSKVFESCCRGGGLLDRDGVVKYTTHSSRHTFAWHAGICGFDNTTIKMAGRWDSDDSFQTYAESGTSDAQILMSDGERNIVKEVWAWRDPFPRSLHGIGEGQMLSIGQQRNRNAKRQRIGCEWYVFDSFSLVLLTNYIKDCSHGRKLL